MKGSKVFLVLAVALIALSACASPSSSTPTQGQAVPTTPPVMEATQPSSVATAVTAPTTAETAAVTAAATSGATSAPSGQASGTINLYTSESEDKVNQMVADFNKLNPNVKVNVFRTGTGDVEAKIQAEQQAGQIQADVIWFADIDFFKNLADKGLMMSYKPQGSDKVPAEYHYNNDQYQEVRLIFNVIAYNTTLVKTPPTSWKDLLDPQYAGKVGMPSALYSGAAFNQVGTFVNMPDFGWQYYQDLNKNKVVVEQANGAVQSKLASGEFAMAQIVDFFARDSKNSGSPVEMIWPKEGALLVPTPIGILKSTKNPDAAKAFLDYMYTDSAQNLFVKQDYISVVPGVNPPPGTPDMTNMKVLMPDLAYINSHRDEITSKFKELFGAPAK